MPEPEIEKADQELRGLVDAARGVWMRRLIDPSRANPLLFYRDLKVGTLDLSAAVEAVERLLLGETLPAEALVPPDAAADEGDPAAAARAAAGARERVRHALVALQRKAQSNHDEKGLETLHLALGLATWPASDGGRPFAAPLLLLPARIERRGRAGDDQRLAVAGEPQLNPVLVYMLEELHSLRIDGPSLVGECGAESESGEWRIDPECAFASVERAAAGVPGFAVQRRVILANFQFAKLAMVEDLKQHGDALAASAVVAAIAGHGASRQSLARAVLEPVQLDARPADGEFLVLDADSTQQQAIVLASSGQSAVVQGPPGTGKSQTIANLIAQSVADGRRVLFVAEKRAALEAVIKRLSHPDVGLGHLMLDLHGASVSRREAMAQLARTLEEIRHAPPAEATGAVHREFEARRKRLNEHARRINAPRQPTGLSLNHILGRLLRLPAGARSAVRVRGEALRALTAEAFDGVKEALQSGAAHPALLLGTDPSPWNGADLRTGPAAERALDQASRAVAELWPAFEEQLGVVALELGMPQPSTLAATLAATREVLLVLGAVRAVRARYDAALFAERPGELARALAPAARGRLAFAFAWATDALFRAARGRLRALRTAPAPANALREEALAADDALRRWRALGAASDVPVEAASEARLASALAALTEVTAALGAVTAGGSFEAAPLADVAARLRALAGDRRTPYLLPETHAVRARLAGAGLAPLLDDLRAGGAAPEAWAGRLEHAWLFSALEDALASDPALAAFRGRAHEDIVSEFVRLDRERLRLAAERVRRLHAERAIAAMNEHVEEAQLVKAEAHKKSRHLPLRDLLARAPLVLTRIAPCWLASPLSVSQLLDGGKRHFDVVVFDEASQVLQEEAVPSLYRAQQVVVAGDRHQLPPTTFFATTVEGEDETLEDDAEVRKALATATAAIGGFESLLGTLEAFLPNHLLAWHYRSEDERLIAFSNTHIYDARLVTFPSARGAEALRHVLVPHEPGLGGELESASPEVEEVVRQVLLHAQTRPDESLGVITMGIQHKNRVQAALDAALALRPELSPFFAFEREERFFVKNLETVQGDERDAILLSIGYGKTAGGDLPHRFGPLTQEAGHRRLNVAVTRARSRMCVVSSFAAHEIDLERSGSEGVRLLKAYLEYAAGGGARAEEPAGPASESPLEADVRAALEARGVAVRARYGASRRRIDLVAMHPSKPGRPVLAIECDGASYHAHATARDRDRLRQSHLQRLGWRFHRIWSTDWFYGREQELVRMLAACAEAEQHADRLDAEGSPEAAPPAEAAVQPAASERLPAADRRGPRPSVPVRERIDLYSERELQALARWVVSDGLLRTDEELIRELFLELPFKRLGARIRMRLELLVQGLSPGGAPGRQA